MYKNDKVIRRYSEPFKLKILDELTTGKLNKSQLGKLYGINPTTINEWIRKYNRKDLMNTRIKVETKDEITRIKALHQSGIKHRYQMIIGFKTLIISVAIISRGCPSNNRWRNEL